MAKALATPAKLAPMRAEWGNRTRVLMEALADGQKRKTCELAEAVGVPHTRYVWGMLRERRATGGVFFYDGFWSLNPSFLPKRLAKAAELLRKRGWTVEPPKC